MGSVNEKLLKFLGMRRQRLRLELKYLTDEKDIVRQKVLIRDAANLHQRITRSVNMNKTFDDVIKSEEIQLKRVQKKTFLKCWNNGKKGKW